MKRINVRGFEETYFDGQHLTLSDLKREKIEHKYLFNSNIAAYPESVELHGEKVCHVTGRGGLEGIFMDLGFRQTSDTSHFLWWELSITTDEICSAEQRFPTPLLPLTHNQLPFLQYFTSKAFQKESPYGNFRFTLSIRELLYHYGNQFCPGNSPVLRVYETVLYQQEILYTIVVHPRNIHCYDDYPRLPNFGEGVCGYADGLIWWRCQSPSESYLHSLNVNWNKQYYVWDHVCLALHMEPGWVLHMDQDRLFKRVNVCEVSQRHLIKPPETPLSLYEADNILTNLKAGKGYAGVRD
ncbi:uncharacterized protein LOC130432965 [Triplophysa dalaica]|uniref:uncharacterized protein LOC130432965 n=1 Tax=Triplophysa dalaica TaxID=1582913 RepID=UPI0024DFEC1D|nr:uncharacterized protein LOC130432965 [Triplophysa dalaica]XP_056618569.1 uncharacterized protein LOC130432965 [Triplophysa dalaica]